MSNIFLLTQDIMFELQDLAKAQCSRHGKMTTFLYKQKKKKKVNVILSRLRGT